MRKMAMAMILIYQSSRTHLCVSHPVKMAAKVRLSIQVSLTLRKLETKKSRKQRKIQTYIEQPLSPCPFSGHS